MTLVQNTTKTATKILKNPLPCTTTQDKFRRKVKMQKLKTPFYIPTKKQLSDERK